MLRDYQLAICERVKEAFEAHRSVMMQMPTGTGKTVVLAELVKRYLDKSLELREISLESPQGSRQLTLASNKNSQSSKLDTISYQRCQVLIVAHRIELIDQIGEHLRGYGIAYGVIAGGRKTKKVESVMVASIQTLSSKLSSLNSLLTPSLVVIDEAHHALAKTYKMLWAAWPEAKFLGLTATPYRMSGDGFTDLFEVLVDSWSVKQFIADGWLSPYDYYSIRPDSEEQQEIDSLKKRGADGDFQMKELREKLDVRPSIERLFESFERFAFDKKGIIYAIDIAHAEHIAEFYRQQGIAAMVVSSKTPSMERKRLIALFRASFFENSPNPSYPEEGLHLTSGPLSSREGSNRRTSERRAELAPAIPSEEEEGEANRSASLCSDIKEAGGIKAHSSVVSTHVPCDSAPAALQILVSVDLFSEGFDCPDVEFIQMARPTLSLAKYLQMVGRGLRPCKGKQCCTIIDNVGLYRTFGLPSVDRDWGAYFVGNEALGIRNEELTNGNDQFLWLGSGDLREENDADIVKIISHEGMQSQFTKLSRRGFEHRKKGKVWVWIDMMNGVEFDRHPKVINYRGMELSTADGDTFFPRISSKWMDAKHGISRKALETQVGEGIGWMKLYISFAMPDKVLQLQAVKPSLARIYKDEQGKVYLQQDPDHAPVSEEEAGGRKAFMALCDKEQKAWEETKKRIRKEFWVDETSGFTYRHRPMLRKRGFVELLYDGDVVYILNIHEERFMPYRNWEIRADNRICTIGNKLYFNEEKDASSYRIKKRSDDFRMFIVEERIEFNEFIIINEAGKKLEIKTL